MKTNEIDRAFDIIERVMDNPEAFPESFVAIPRDPDIITRVLSRERVKILNYLEKYGPTESLQALADGLDRDKSAVSRDIDTLKVVGLVNVSKNGRRKRLSATHRPILIV